MQDLVEQSEHFVVLFDETMNVYLQKKLLDYHVRLRNSGEVGNKYFTWSFLGHSTAADLFEKLTESFAPLLLNKVTQLSMYRPNIGNVFMTSSST